MKNAMSFYRNMVSEESINLAKNLLKKQFPKISRFQETVIGKAQSFDIIKTDKNLIQLLILTLVLCCQCIRK